jgi:hypothetical protein
MRIMDKRYSGHEKNCSLSITTPTMNVHSNKRFKILRTSSTRCNSLNMGFETSRCISNVILIVSEYCLLSPTQISDF